MLEPKGRLDIYFLAISSYSPHLAYRAVLTNIRRNVTIYRYLLTSSFAARTYNIGLP